MNRTHFHSFDAFRFFSFLIVFAFHTIPRTSSLSFFSKSGTYGVDFFFVLSGFLITYILVFEKQQAGKISLKNFYVRRILRIWPLFYLMLAFAYFTPRILGFLHLSSSDEGYTPNWLVSILFLENYKMMFTHSFPNVSPLRVMWSLCIEEHFYLLWGIAIFFTRIKWIPVLIAGSVLVATASRIVYRSIGIDDEDLFSNLDYFAFGAIPAYVLLMKENKLYKIQAVPLWLKYMVLLLAVAFVFLLPNQHVIPHIAQPLILGPVFSLVLMFSVCKENAITINDSSVFSQLGRYTYGFYLYHTIFINLFLQLNKSYAMHWLAVALLSLCGTIIAGIFSYYLFEKQFLKLKKHFR